MKIHFKKLDLITKRNIIETIEFSPQVTFIHGPVGTGKSTVARMIDFCLGSRRLEQTPALQQEFISAQLLAQIGQYTVQFERNATDRANVRVTWESENKNDTGSLLAPLSKGPTPILAENVFNLSDLIFHFSGVDPIKVRRSKTDPDSPLVRLSFRDVMWYCYLEQERLDSSFFRMEDFYRRLKSIDVMRFVVGLHSERLNELEIELDSMKQAQRTKRDVVKQIRHFLDQFHFGTDSEITDQFSMVESELNEAIEQKRMLEQEHARNTHFADSLRDQLRQITDQLEQEELALYDVGERIRQQVSLRSELITAKVKTARTEVALSVLAGVTFRKCPACGLDIHQDPSTSPEICNLCGRSYTATTALSQLDPEAIRRDLNDRIDELQDSIDRHKREATRQSERIETLKIQKSNLDRQLSKELEQYDSAFLSNARATERRIAELEERKRSLEKLTQIPKSIEQLEQEAGALQGEIDLLTSAIREERQRLSHADRNIETIEDTFLETMHAITFPGVEQKDRVQIHRQNWRPFVIHRNDEELTWDFYDAGSGGKKVLFNVCYALAVHKVASENNLPLPRFLIIDTPMKNISRDVDPALVVSFYHHLYRLADGVLRDTQFIIIDSDLVRPESETIAFQDRLMSFDDPNNPPLISYYRGP